jgi:hypothetical protein
MAGKSMPADTQLSCFSVLCRPFRLAPEPAIRDASGLAYGVFSLFFSQTSLSGFLSRSTALLLRNLFHPRGGAHLAAFPALLDEKIPRP